MRKRVNVYIDGSNFYRACKGELNRTDVSIGDFANKLVGNREHGRTYYYNVKVSPNFNRGAYETQKRFFTASLQNTLFGGPIGPPCQARKELDGKRR